MKKIKFKIENNRIGLIGEMLVMAELLLHGFNPAKSYFDNGIDIILQNGLKIQVKTSIYREIPGRIHFCVTKGNDKLKIKLSNYVDFLICVTLPERNFYIIPCKELKIKATISISNKSKYNKYLNNWDLLKRWEVTPKI